MSPEDVAAAALRRTNDRIAAATAAYSEHERVNTDPDASPVCACGSRWVSTSGWRRHRLSEVLRAGDDIDATMRLSAAAPVDDPDTAEPLRLELYLAVFAADADGYIGGDPLGGQILALPAKLLERPAGPRTDGAGAVNEILAYLDQRVAWAGFLESVRSAVLDIAAPRPVEPVGEPR